MEQVMSSGNSMVTYKEIPGFPNYRVGDDGSVWSRWARVYTAGVSGVRYVAGPTWRKMSLRINKRLKYASVGLHAGNSSKHVTRYVHHLVLEAFIGPCPPGQEARHFPDNDRANNRRNNLQWATRVVNANDKRMHGTLLIGTKHPLTKITAAQVRAIRDVYARGNTTQETLAARYKVCRQHISGIILNKYRKQLC
jgi:hypothetical protein